jgi:hypothetical protein
MRKIIATPVLVAAAIALLGMGPAVPSVWLGTWNSAHCGQSDTALVIRPTTARLGTGHFAPVHYIPDDDRQGHGGAIHWDQEYEVDNFVYRGNVDKIVHNTQGYGMPGQVVFTRCSVRLHS